MNAARTPVTVIRPPCWGDVWSAATLVQLRSFTHLFIELSRHRLRVRYKQSVLGPLWALIQPLAMMGVFTFVFSWLVKMPSQGVPYPLFAYAGLLPWTFFASAASSGTNSLTGHAALVTKVAFPREILPATYIVAAGFDFLVGSITLVLLGAWFRVPFGWQAVAAVPLMALLAVCAFAATLVLSAVNVRVRDVGVALPIALQLLMFASPVLYPLGIVPARLRHVYLLNPLVGVIDAFRNAILGRPIDGPALLVAAAWVVVGLPAAFFFFKRVERTMADEV